MNEESTGVWSWLIGSPLLRLGEAGVEFGFERPIPAWAWALVVLGAAAFGVFGYRRMEGAFWARATLGALRAAVLVALAVLICGPRLIKLNEREEKDWVLVLVDRSGSMNVADVAAGNGEGRQGTREAELRGALASARGVFEELGAERVVVWLGFDGGAYDLTLAEGGAVPVLGEPMGRRTDLNRALEQALKRAAARPLAGVVVLSDGRSLAEPSRALVRRLEAERVPVFTVALGSAAGLPDVGVRRVESPRTAFVKDSVPVQVEIVRTGPAARAGDAEKMIVELVDETSGAVLDTREIVWPEVKAVGGAGGDGAAEEPVEQVEKVTLTTKPTGAGASRWSVRVRSAGGAPDMVAENNTAEVAIELVDRPLRVAYFDGYPRWEYRYIKNLLVREASLASVVMLLAPGKRYIQEGTVILDALPRTAEEWAKFDVIMIGDLWPGVMTTEQLEQIKERVSVGGAGLIWIGGEGATPGAWRSTPMADLLPFVLGEQSVVGAGGGNGLPVFDGPVTIAPTAAAERLGVLRLSDEETNGMFWPPALSDPSAGWSRLYWAQRIDPGIIKPTAETLATATPVPEGGVGRENEARPIVLSMRFGAGRVLYVGTDEIWRWRYARGEQLPERFWIQMVRLLGRESVARSGRAAMIEVAPERAEVEQPVRVAVTLIDQSLVDAAPASLRVKVVRVGGVDGKGESAAGGGVDQPSMELTLTPEGGAASGGAGRARGTRTFAATWVPTESGRYRAEAIDPLLVSAASSAAVGRGDLSAKVEVWQPDDEMRRPQANHALLAALSSATKGQVLRTDELGQLPRLLPNRRLMLTGEPEVHTLWDTPLALMVVVLLLTAEWIGRRLLRLA